MLNFFSFFNLICAAFIALLGIILFLNIFGLPANWIIVALVTLWNFLLPENLPLWFWIIFIGLAVSGEVLEFFLQVFQGKRYGSSSAGNFAGMAGAFIGAIFLAPLFWGIGALIGALLGAWTGCFLMELARGNNTQIASKAAFGSMLGKLLGTICKMGIGAGMIYITAKLIWPAPNLYPGQHLETKQFFFTSFELITNII